VLCGARVERTQLEVPSIAVSSRLIERWHEGKHFMKLKRLAQAV